jgi:hypothetical protein
MVAPSRVSGLVVWISKFIDRGVMRPRLRALEKKAHTLSGSAWIRWLLARVWAVIGGFLACTVFVQGYPRSFGADVSRGCITSWLKGVQHW